MFRLSVQPTNMPMVIGAAAAFVVLTLGASIYTLVKVSKARKDLDRFAAEHAFPPKELLKEFKKNLKHIAKLKNNN